MQKIAKLRVLLAAIWLGMAICGCGFLAPRGGTVVVDHLPLTCNALVGLIGAEDISVHAPAKVAYISSADRRAVLNGDAPQSPDGLVGHIYRVDLSQKRPKVWDVTPEGLSAAGFYPHGVSLLTRRDGGALLFVINHGAIRDAPGARWREASGPNAIEIFNIAPSSSGSTRLTRTQRVTDPALISPNDIAAVGDRQFYVTNEHGSRPGLRSTLRDLAGNNDGNLLYFDGTQFHLVLNLPWANGVNVDLSRNRLYVASSSRGSITTLGWQGLHHPARLSPSIDPLLLNTSVDNIELDAGTGDLLIAAHPNRLRLIALRFRLLSIDTAPSQVLAVHRRQDGSLDPHGAREILSLAGSEPDADQIAAASVAASFQNPATGQRRFLLGSIFSNRILICDEKHAPSSVLRF